MQGFKVFVALIYLVVPLCLWGAGRKLGLSHPEAAWVGILSCWVWSCDPMARLFREFGGFSFLGVSVLSLLTVALTFSYFVTPSPRRLPAIFLLTAACLWLHAGSFLLLGLGFAGVLLAQAGRVKSKVLGPWALVNLLAVATTLPWLIPLAENLRWMQPNAEILRPSGWSELVETFAFRPGSRFQTGIYLAGLLGLASRRARALKVTRSLAPALVCFLLLASTPLGGHAPFLALQAKRFSLTASFWLTVPAALLVESASSRLRPPVALFTLGATVLTGSAFQLIPWGQLLARAPQRQASLADRVFVPSPVAELGAWLQTLPPGTRVLVEDAGTLPAREFAGAYVVGLWGLERRIAFLNGYPALPIAHAFGGFDEGNWLGRPVTSFSPEDMTERLRRYGLQFLVVCREDTAGYLLMLPSVKPNGRLGNFQIFSVVRPTRLAEGATAVWLDYGCIWVQGATHPRTLLRFRWHQALRTKPPLPLTRVAYEDDPVGLILVENGSVKDFVVEGGVADCELRRPW